MSFDQVAALFVLVAVIAALVWGKVRSDVVALTGAAALLATGTIRPVEVQSAFASPALIALAALFVIAYAMELSGLLDFFIRKGTALCRRLGAAGLWLVILFCGAASAFLNNTPIVVLSAPVVRDVAISMKLSPRRFLIPLSYAAVLGGCCTLIGTSTNLLVNDMARAAGQPTFAVFEISGVGLIVALTGGAFLFLVGGRLLDRLTPTSGPGPELDAEMLEGADSGSVGHAEVFSQRRPLKPVKALLSLAVFVGVVVAATFGWAPIAASAFAGAVLLILLRVISAEEAYAGLRPEILLLIAGMVVIGLSLEVTGLAAAATDGLVSWVRPLGPLGALVILYGVTLFLTEALSNATVAVLVTPVAVALGESLGVDPRPFIVAVMIAASAAFATPFGYQTNVLVYQLGGYSYTDFLKVGLPLNLITWAAAIIAIPVFFPF
ncbi:SLC13 family permease [Phenylobacterium sp.]|jgi:di/tricarboxylate transporter|uniref:SLC13 family permease n=1 Tax=Phenylobacterium sp. TaxID=1871053 RepID=UPI002E361E2E|nr:SLC13 family permease [Phenylobacterium sp.]HEX2561318.1 SLC13 family permease [Phenylobacterium sp.]